MTIDRDSEGRTPGIAATQLLRPLQRAHLDRNLITDFFFVFSRFEFALKRAGFVKPNPPKRKPNSKSPSAKPDWDAFGDSIEQLYESHRDPEFARAVHYLLTASPKRQIVRDDGSLGWDEDRERGNRTEIRWLLLLVRRVRNNLFHGGKYPYTPLPEPARDTQLLESSLTVLAACLRWHKAMYQWFMDDLNEHLL